MDKSGGLRCIKVNLQRLGDATTKKQRKGKSVHRIRHNKLISLIVLMGLILLSL